MNICYAIPGGVIVAIFVTWIMHIRRNPPVIIMFPPCSPDRRGLHVDLTPHHKAGFRRTISIAELAEKYRKGHHETTK